jgi:hypothetical protein
VPGKQAAVVVPPPLPPAPPQDAARAELDETLNRLECASLRTARSSQGAETISGSVRDLQDQAKLLAIANRLPAERRPEIHVDVVPPPLCGAVRDFGDLRRDGLASEGQIELHVARGTDALRQGDPIAVQVKSSAKYALNLRIDYFTLEGQVLHMWPNPTFPAARLAAGETREFLNSGPGNQVWRAGGAPFGTEMVTVTATPQPLDFTPAPQTVEPASDYLRRLKDALRRGASPSGQPNLIATVLVHTSEK